MGGHRPQRGGQDDAAADLSANLHPTSRYASILDEVLGAVDVFELRPRIGVTSAALADRIPRSEAVGNVIVSAAYAVVGRWTSYGGRGPARRTADGLLRIERLGKRHLRHAGRAQARSRSRGP